MFEKNAIGVDLSHHNAIVKFTLLNDAGFDFVILKGGGCEDRGGEVYQDSKFSGRVQEAYDAGFKVIGSYYFGSPGYWLKRQYTMNAVERMADDNHPLVKHILEIYRFKAIDFLAIDMETASETPTSTSQWHAFFVRDLVERIRRQQSKGNLRAFKLGVYSRRTWIDDKAKDLDVWLGTQPDLFIWTANWARGSLTVKPAREIAKERPVSGHQARAFGWSPQREKTWHIWQWAGDDARSHGFKPSDAVLNVNGLPTFLDLNLYNGTREDMLKWLGKAPAQPTPAPVPEPTPVPVPQPDELIEKVRAIYERLDELKSICLETNQLVKDIDNNL